jgi:hypothetical protein
MYVKNGRISCSPQEWFDGRDALSRGAIQYSLYGYGLDMMMGLFGSSRMLIIVNENLAEDPNTELKRVEKFLRLSPFDFVPTSEKGFRSRKFLDQDLNKRLMDLFAGPTLRLQEYLSEKDLMKWETYRYAKGQ